MPGILSTISSSDWQILLVLFTNDQIVSLTKLKKAHLDGSLDEETIEHKRLLYLEWLYQSGRIKD